MAGLVLFAGFAAAFCFDSLIFLAHVGFGRRELLAQIFDEYRQNDLLLGQVELGLVVGILVEFASDGFLIQDFTGDQNFAHVIAELRGILQGRLSGLALLSLGLREL